MEKRKLFLPILLIVLSIASLTISGLIVMKSFSTQSLPINLPIPTPNPTNESQTKIDCENPRPEVCTMECTQPPPYICGSDGKSYCSVCQACSNINIAWYEMKNSDCGEGKICGGIAGAACPDGYSCKYDGDYPDAGGNCIKTDTSSTIFTCPPGEWVNCMPGPNAGVRKECTSEYLNWAKENCPNFKGAAL